tara:strand:+ start:282 stop:725 length:444 start_codon:yes stop_codon:yes gene_type:complete
MVCLGNICRSPMAEGILRDKISKLSYDIEVDSAGTAAYHIGEAPDSRMIETAMSKGINISDLRARQFCVNDFDVFDKIYAMDASNLSNMQKLARNKSDLDKLDLLLNCKDSFLNKSVPDPYYGGEDGFFNIYDILEESIEFILKNKL